MTDIVAMITLAVTLLGVLILNKNGRKVFAFGLFAITVATFAFVFTRTGIGEHMLNYEKTPDQFFYAQTMVFIFISMWVVSSYVKTKRRTIIAAAAVGLFIVSTAPYGSSFGENSLLYKGRGDIYLNTSIACQASHDGMAQVAIYPSDPWTLKMDKSVICD
jgi:hypothetical protein